MTSEIQIKEGKQPKPKKEKRKLSGIAKFFIWLFSVVIGLPALCIGALYACFYDGSHSSVPHRNGISQEVIMSEVLTNAFDTVNIDSKLHLGVTSEQINSLLYDIVKDNEIIKNLYFSPNSKQIEAVIELNIKSIFKTKATLTMGCKLQNVKCKDDSSRTELAIVLNISNIKIGRISGMQKVLDFVKKFITLPDLNSTFEKTGLHFEVDLDKLQILYRMNTLYEDIKDKIGTKSSSEFFSIAKEIFANEEMLSISAGNGKVFDVGVNLDTLVVTKETLDIDGYEIPSDSFFIDSSLNRPEFIRTTIKSLLDKGEDDGLKLDDCDLVAKYIMGGNALVTDPLQQVIISDYVANGLFDDLTEHKTEIISGEGIYSYDVPPAEQIKNVLVSDITQQLISHPTSVATGVTTRNIDTMFAGSVALGYMTIFACDKSTTKDSHDYEVNYVLPERMTSVISSDSNENMFITISVSFNGKQGHITLKSTKDTSGDEFGKIVYHIGDMYLGDYIVSEETQDALMSIIRAALSDVDIGHVIKFDGTNDKITFDLTEVFTECGISSTMFDCEITTASNDPVTGLGSVNINIDHK